MNRACWVGVAIVTLASSRPLHAGVFSHIREPDESADYDEHHRDFDWDFAAAMSVSTLDLDWVTDTGQQNAASPYVGTVRGEFSVRKDKCACPNARGLLGLSIGGGDDVLLFDLQVGAVLTIPLLTWGQFDYGFSVGAEAYLEAAAWDSTTDMTTSTEDDGVSAMMGVVRGIVSFRIERSTSIRLHFPLASMGSEYIHANAAVGLVIDL